VYRTISKPVRIANDSVAITCSVVTNVCNLYPDISNVLAHVTSNLNQDTKASINKRQLNNSDRTNLHYVYNEYNPDASH